MQDIVVIDAEDTDVIVMAAHIAHEVEGKLYLKKRKATYDCRTMCNTQLVKIIVPLHIHSGVDAISAWQKVNSAKCDKIRGLTVNVIW